MNPLSNVEKMSQMLDVRPPRDSVIFILGISIIRIAACILKWGPV